MGWYRDNSGNVTHDVGGKLPNDFGLHDMHGNVFEWCEDVYNGNFYDSESAYGPDPLSTGGSERRVARGGFFNTGARFSRSARRYANDLPSSRSPVFGVRPAILLPADASVHAACESAAAGLAACQADLARTAGFPFDFMNASNLLGLGPRSDDANFLYHALRLVYVEGDCTLVQQATSMFGVMPAPANRPPTGLNHEWFEDTDALLECAADPACTGTGGLEGSALAELEERLTITKFNYFWDAMLAESARALIDACELGVPLNGCQCP